MRSTVLLYVLLAAGSALGQKDEIFGTGKPPVFREADMDRRFARSKLGKALKSKEYDERCVQLLGGLLTALAETAPYLHRRDETFTLDPYLLEAINTQLTIPQFPGNAVWISMVRRVLIDGRLPDEWLELATELNPTVKIIDLGKLKLLNEGIKPIDSHRFSLLALRERFALEVHAANSAVTTDVEAAFRDAYLDREVSWGGAVLLDTGVNSSKKKGKKPRPESEELVALLQWIPPDPHAGELQIFKKRTPPPPVKIYAHLAAKQYLDLERIPRGKRMLVKGRFWEMNRSVTEVELKNALLFEDRDFSRGVLLADPNAVAACPLAINELTGVAPAQPGGFAH